MGYVGSVGPSRKREKVTSKRKHIATKPATILAGVEKVSALVTSTSPLELLHCVRRRHRLW